MGEGITTYHLLFCAEYIEVINGRAPRFPKACRIDLSLCIRHTHSTAWARPYHWARREFKQTSGPWQSSPESDSRLLGGVLQMSAVPSAACSALRSTDLASRPLCLGQRFSPYRPQLATRAAPPSNPWLVFFLDFVLICLQPQAYFWLCPGGRMRWSFAAASLAVFCSVLQAGCH